MWVGGGFPDCRELLMDLGFELLFIQIFLNNLPLASPSCVLPHFKDSWCFLFLSFVTGFCIVTSLLPEIPTLLNEASGLLDQS